MTQVISKDAALLATAGHAKIMMCGRAAQEQNIEISALLLRISGVSAEASEAHQRAMDSISALTAGRAKGFFARLRGGPALPSPEELRKRLDAVAVALTVTEQALHKDAKRIGLLAERLEKTETMMARAVGLLAEVRDGDGVSPDARQAAMARLADLAPSWQVCDHTRLSLAVMMGNIAAMREHTRIVLEERLPVWDRLVDALMINRMDPEATQALTRAAEEARASAAQMATPEMNGIETPRLA